MEAYCCTSQALASMHKVVLLVQDLPEARVDLLNTCIDWGLDNQVMMGRATATSIYNG